jgi:excisionase family DNA binding protein
MIEADAPPAKSELEARPLAYSVKAAARATGLGESTVRREIRAGRLKKIHVRGRVLITDEELRRYLAAAS